jgi:alkylation response protein AidB-like acyl-CoA dehydrogenase
MKPSARKKMADLLKNAAAFAQEKIAPREELAFSAAFPYDIWKELGQEKLLGIGIPEAQGGLGGSYDAISRAGETLVKYGHNMGIVLSLFLQNLAGKFLIQGFGNERQRDDILPKMATGEITVSFAVSEPGAGAHPKLIKTRALSVNDGYVLTGEKTYLTNGPIANLFIVIAVTDVVDGKKRYSAFMVPKNMPGLTVSEPMHIEALRPSPHGGIVLTDCFVPELALLGNRHTAYEDMVKPFREVEDVMMMGPLTGGAGYQLAKMVHGFKHAPHISDDQKTVLAKIHSLIHAAKLVARDSAALLDDTTRKADTRTAIIGFRTIFSEIQSLFGLVSDSVDVENDKSLAAMTRDLEFSGRIASNAAKTREIRYGNDILNNAHPEKKI